MPFAHAEPTITTKSNDQHLLIEVHWSADTQNTAASNADGSKQLDHSILYIDVDMDAKMTKVIPPLGPKPKQERTELFGEASG